MLQILIHGSEGESERKIWEERAFRVFCPYFRAVLHLYSSLWLKLLNQKHQTPNVQIKLSFFECAHKAKTGPSICGRIWLALFQIRVIHEHIWLAAWQTYCVWLKLRLLGKLYMYTVMPPPTGRGESPLNKSWVQGSNGISLSSTSRLRTDYAWRRRSWRSNITFNLLPRLTLCVSLCLAERGGDGADCCPIWMICEHLRSQRVCAGLEKWRKRGWRLDWLDCGWSLWTADGLCYSAVLFIPLVRCWFLCETGGKNKREGIMGKLFAYSLLSLWSVWMIHRTDS